VAIPVWWNGEARFPIGACWWSPPKPPQLCARRNSAVGPQQRQPRRRRLWRRSRRFRIPHRGETRQVCARSNRATIASRFAATHASSRISLSRERFFRYDGMNLPCALGLRDYELSTSRARKRVHQPKAQLVLAFPNRWGGARKGAGRKAGPRPKTAHRTRPIHRGWAPVHVTLRSALRIMRSQQVFRVMQRALRRSLERAPELFRVLPTRLDPIVGRAGASAPIEHGTKVE
jgi:hypothetical protein